MTEVMCRTCGASIEYWASDPAIQMLREEPNRAPQCDSCHLDGAELALHEAYERMGELLTELLGARSIEEHDLECVCKCEQERPLIEFERIHGDAYNWLLQRHPETKARLPYIKKQAGKRL